MAQYDTPPGVDPRTGRIPPYKQVLSQDNSTGTYKVKYEYTKSTPLTRNEMTVRPGPVPAVTPLPIAYYENPADAIKRGLTTPQTTFGSSGGYMGGGGGGGGDAPPSTPDIPGDGSTKNPIVNPQTLPRGGGDGRQDRALPESFDFEAASINDLAGILNPSRFDKTITTGFNLLAPAPLQAFLGIATWNQKRMARNELQSRLENNPETTFSGLTLNQLKDLNEMDLTPEVNEALTTTIANWNPNLPVQKPVNPNTYTGPFPVQKPVNPNAVAPGDEMSELDRIAETTYSGPFPTRKPIRTAQQISSSASTNRQDAIAAGDVESAVDAARRESGYSGVSRDVAERNMNNAAIGAGTNNPNANYGANETSSERRDRENSEGIGAAREAASNTEAEGGREVDRDNAVDNAARSNEVSDRHGNAVTNTDSNGTTTAVGFGSRDVSNMGRREGDGGSNSGGRIICTELYRQGLISRKDYMLDLYYTSKHLTPQHTAGYWHFAVPAVKAMRRSKFWTAFWREIAYNRLQDIKWRLGYGKFTLKGRIYSAIFEPFCYISGYFKPNATYKELYKGEY